MKRRARVLEDQQLIEFCQLVPKQLSRIVNKEQQAKAVVYANERMAASSNSSALAFPNGFFDGYTFANAKVYVLSQSHNNSAWIFPVTEQLELRLRE